MSEPEIALVFSPEPWVEQLHRYCTDHGGALVRQVVMDPAVALDEEYSTLVVSHRWPALTRGLVDAVHARGRRVLGVADPQEPASREHLRALEVDDVVASDMAMPAIVAALRALEPPDPPTEKAPIAVVPRPHPDRAAPVVVVGGPPGAGATELAIGLAVAADDAGRRTVLVDADDTDPAVAPRLALPIEPSLRSAVDAVEHGSGRVVDALVAGPRPDLLVLGGLPSASTWRQVRVPEVLAVVEALTAIPASVVVDSSGRLEELVVGGRDRHGIARAMVARADALVAVADGTPVGVIRLLGWLAESTVLNARAPVHVVVNRAPPDAFRRGEIVEELAASCSPSSVSFVPHDRKVERASWSASAVGRGAFTRAVAALAGRVLAGGAAPAAVPHPEPADPLPAVALR